MQALGRLRREEFVAKSPKLRQNPANRLHCASLRPHGRARRSTLGGSMSGSILYIHGFNSSPLSRKALQLEAVMQQLGLADQLRVPALHHHPRQAIAQLEGAIAELGHPYWWAVRSAATMPPTWPSAMA